MIELIKEQGKLALKNKALSKTFLKKVNEIAHLKLFTKSLAKFDIQYSDFNKFINSYELFLTDNMEFPSKSLSSQDKIFEGIITRLDALSCYKNITLKIYLEAQKNPKYFLTINKFINSFFKSFLKSQTDIIQAYVIYIYAFNVWIEDNDSMDKTMAAIGNSFDTINKYQKFFKK